MTISCRLRSRSLWATRVAALVIAATTCFVGHAQSPQQLPGPTAPSAETLLKNALRMAVAHNRAVFVVFGASWCPPCWKLDAFLKAPETSKVQSPHMSCCT